MSNILGKPDKEKMIQYTNGEEIGIVKESIKQLVSGEVDSVLDNKIKENIRILHQSDIVPRTIKPGAIETCFGSMYGYKSAQTTTVSAADTWYEVTGGLTSGGNLDGMTFPDDYYLITNYGGLFLVHWSMSIGTSTAGDEVMGTVGVNNTANNLLTAQGSVSANNLYTSVSGTGILSLSTKDTISLFVQNDTAGRNVVMEHATVSLVRIGR